MSDLLSQNRPNPNNLIVKGDKLASYLGISERQIRNLAVDNESRKAIIFKKGDNRYLFHQSVKAYIRYLRDYQGIDSDNAIDVKKARATKEYYQAEEQKLKVQTLKKDLVNLEDVSMYLSQIFTEVRQGLSQVGMNIRNDLVGKRDLTKIKEIIDNAINSELNQLADSSERIMQEILGDSEIQNIE
ncbi:hypothetical protein [Francisella philomiragia]|uniref:hypothetical protein n=1 Tax=Francisella philomiragia TaxID=28110 RepID=UPI0022448B48|nr:hypothetical protein [Francisella philomiragia]